MFVGFVLAMSPFIFWAFIHAFNKRAENKKKRAEKELENINNADLKAFLN